MPRTARANIGRQTRRTNNRRLQRRSQSEEQLSAQNQLQRDARSRTRSASQIPNPINPASRRTTRLPRRVVQDMEYAAFNYGC